MSDRPGATDCLQPGQPQGSEAVHICLYSAIPEENEFKPRRYGFLERCKAIIRNALNSLFTNITGRLFFNIHSYSIAHGLADNCNRGDMAIRIALRSQIRAAFSPRKVCFAEVKWGELAGKIAPINRNTSLFVIAGGGYISIDGDGSPWAMLADSHALEELECPVVACGIGLNRLMNEPLSDISRLPEVTRGKISDLSRLCRKLSVRDLDTLNLFASCGQKGAVLTGDPALYFDDNAGSVPGGSKRLMIGVNLAAHGRRTYSMLEPILPHIVEFLRWIQKGRGADLVYLMHHDYERPIAKYLRKKGLKLRIIDCSAENLMEAYKELDFVVNQMLHSCIFAANAGVPFLNMAYDVKCLAFCNLMDVPECGVSHEQVSFELLSTRFDHLFENRGALSGRIMRVRASLRSQSHAFWEDTVKLVTQKGWD